MTHPSRYLPNKAQKPVRGSMLNYSHPLARGLVCAYLLNEATGGVLKNLAGKADLIFGTGTYEPIWVSNTISFDGGDYAKVQELPIPASDFFDDWQFTLASKIKLDTTGIGSMYAAGFSSLTNNLQRNLVLGSRSANLIYEVSYFSSGAEANLATGVVTNRWYSLVGFSSASNSHTLYVDGKFIETDTTDMVLVPSAYLDTTALGARFESDNVDGLEHFQGDVEYFYAWNRVLTPEEIALLYREPYCMF